MARKRYCLSVRASLLDERRAGLIAEAVVLDAAVGLPRRPVVELRGEGGRGS